MFNKTKNKLKTKTKQQETKQKTKQETLCLKQAKTNVKIYFL